MFPDQDNESNVFFQSEGWADLATIPLEAWGFPSSRSAAIDANPASTWVTVHHPGERKELGEPRKCEAQAGAVMQVMKSLALTQHPELVSLQTKYKSQSLYSSLQ